MAGDTDVLLLITRETVAIDTPAILETATIDIALPQLVPRKLYRHISVVNEKIEKEIREAEEAIFKATGQRPQGFRGPGFSWSKDLLKVLESRGYHFDASTLPTYLGPLARMYYFKKSDLSKEEKKARKELFGKFSEGFRKLKPYKWDLGNGKSITEIPVTTMPVFKLPFHLSYLIYLGNISMPLMKLYLNTAIRMCKITNTPVSFLLHPLDLIGGDQITQLAFFPGMNVSSNQKVKVFKNVIGLLQKHYSVVNMSEHWDFMEKNTKMELKSL